MSISGLSSSAFNPNDITANAPTTGTPLGGASDVQRTLLVDPPDVNDYSSARVADAVRAISANASAVSTKLNGLSVEDRAAYKEIESFLPVMGSEGNKSTIARAALQRLLLSDKLTSTADLGGGQNLVQNLRSLLTQPVASGVDRAELVRNLLCELDNPMAINQQYKGTCVATSVAMVAATKNPAEYTRIVSGLASPEGKVRLWTGDVLEREPGWNSNTDVGYRERTVSGRLLWPALMEHGNWVLNYDNTSDKHDVVGIKLGDGLLQYGGTKVLEAMTGERYETRTIIGDLNRSSAMEEIARLTKQGEFVPAGLNWASSGQHGGHEVVVAGVTDTHVVYVNPWGQLESMTKADFQSRLHGYTAWVGPHADAPRMERPLGVRADANTSNGLGVMLSYNLNPNLALEFGAYMSGTLSAGASYTFGNSDLAPFLYGRVNVHAAGRETAAGDTTYLSTSVGGGVSMVLDNGPEIGIYGGLNTTYANQPEFGVEAGIYAGWRF